MVIILVLLSFIGIGLCLYSLYIEQRMQGGAYKPACDLNDRISCSKTFRSKYGRLFGISLAFYGVIFYSIALALGLMDAIGLLHLAALFAVAASLVLAYIQYFKLQTICLICTSLYIVNILLLVVSYYSK